MVSNPFCWTTMAGAPSNFSNGSSNLFIAKTSSDKSSPLVLPCMARKHSNSSLVSAVIPLPEIANWTVFIMSIVSLQARGIKGNLSKSSSVCFQYLVTL